MHLRTNAWEGTLLSLAHEASSAELSAIRCDAEQKVLEEAYAHCELITAAHSRSFHMASALLPAPKRRAVRALYAFCRITDDIVDEGDENRETELQRWRTRSLSNTPPVDDLVALAWADTRHRFAVPVRYAEQLIEGVTRDLTQTRYTTFDELTGYCYGVASTVGLMSMHIIGYAGNHALPYAIKLGVALQLTNILRDIGTDWQLGRLYLPQEELEFFGLTEEDIAQGEVTEKWRTFMTYQIERNRQLYAEALPGIHMLNGDGRFAIAAAAELYRAILDDIEANDYNVFNRRSFVNTWGKVGRLPGIWWRSWSGYKHVPAGKK